MSDAPNDFEKSLQRITSALAQGGRTSGGTLAAAPVARAGNNSMPVVANASAASPRLSRLAAIWPRLAMVSSGLLVASGMASGHHGLFALALLPAGLAGLFLADKTLGQHGFVYRGGQVGDPSRPQIGLGVSVGKGARIDPGAVVEMGASIGAGAIIESGAVVGMGASIGAGAVLEAGAAVSWGCDVGKNARVSKNSRVGAGSSVHKGACVPPGVWLVAGSDWSGGDAEEGARATAGPTAQPALGAATATAITAVNAPAGIALHANDPRATRLDAVFARIDAELLAAPPLMREHLGPAVRGVGALRSTCASLLEREHALRAEVSPEALRYLAGEREALQGRIAAASDPAVRASLQSAVAAIQEQERQRQLIAQSAERLDAELTRLYWTLDGLGAQLLRLRTAGAEAMQAPDAALNQSVRQLQSEIEAIADALEQVAHPDLANAPATESLAAQQAESPTAPPPMRAELMVGPDGSPAPGAAGTRGKERA